MKAKWKKMFEEYGRLAIIVHLTIFFLTWSCFFVLIQFGFRDTVMEYFQDRLSGESASAGTVFLAYGVTRLVSPIRIAVTAALVPLIARMKTQSE